MATLRHLSPLWLKILIWKREKNLSFLRDQQNSKRSIQVLAHKSHSTCMSTTLTLYHMFSYHLFRLSKCFPPYTTPTLRPVAFCNGLWYCHFLFCFVFPFCCPLWRAGVCCGLVSCIIGFGGWWRCLPLLRESKRSKRAGWRELPGWWPNANGTPLVIIVVATIWMETGWTLGVFAHIRKTFLIKHANLRIRVASLI